MSVVHIATPDGKREVYPEDQVREIWRQGFIPETSLYWQPGMSDWRPAADYFSTIPRPAAAQAPAVALPPRFTFVQDPTDLTRFLKILLWISIVLHVVSVGSDFEQLRLVRAGTVEKEAAAANDLRQQVVAVLVGVNFILTGVTFLRWVYWANRNSRGFGAADLKFTPGWAVGYYFIPILMLFRPYQAMKEIWQVSRNPQSWSAEPASPLLIWWWVLWLLAAVCGQVAFQLALKADSPSTLAAATSADMLLAGIQIPLCLVAMALVQTICRQQKALVEEIL